MRVGPNARWIVQQPGLAFPGPCISGPGGRCQVSLWVSTLLVVWSRGLPLNMSSAQPGLFAQGLAFVQPFNSLHQLED